MVGATYFLDRTWFLDANYSYAMTGTKIEQLGRPVERHDADRRRHAHRNEQRDQFRKCEYSGNHSVDQRGILKPPGGPIRAGRSDS
jgi:hypothetical protein